MNKLIIKSLNVALVFMSAIGLSACGESENGHEHRLFHVAGEAANCIKEGVIEHDHCIYCNKRFVDGKEIEEYVIPIDETNHSDLVLVNEVPANCNSSGVKAHSKCNGCEKIYIDNNLVTNMEELIIPKISEHDFDGLDCKNCDAYKIAYDGKEYLCDFGTRRDFVSNTFAAAHPAGTKTDAFTAGLATRMTFASQGSANIKVVNDKDSWTIVDSVASGTATSSFTRFALGDEENKPYIGKVIVSFDLVANMDFTMSRFGVRVVDSEAVDNYKSTQDLLFGNNANEENNANRTVKSGDVYRFTYALETTENNQFVQIWACSAGLKLDVTLKNLFVFMPGAGEATTPTGKVLTFAKIN